MIRVAIIEDQKDIREGFHALIGGTSGFVVCGAYGTMEDALAAMSRQPPDVLLVDIGLPGMSGIEGTRILKERFPHLQALMLTVFDDDERIFAAICAGACGYLLKKTPPARLLESIQEVMTGGAPMSPEVARRLLNQIRHPRSRGGGNLNLTPHELRVLKLLVEGHSYKTSAADLGVSVNTVSFHVRKIYEKLHVHSKVAAVAKALGEGLL